MTAGLFIIALLVCLFLGIPIFIAMMIPSTYYLLNVLNMQPIMAVSSFTAGLNKFSTLCLPFFILAASVMGKGQIGSRLLKFCRSIVGHMYGGIGMTAIVCCIIIGAISGASTAGILIIGALIYQEMIDNGYPRGFSAGLICTVSSVGMLIPPSNTMIVYSTVAGSVSISALFMAGYVPGLIWGLGVIILATITAKKLGYRGEAKLTASIVLKTFWQAIPSLLMIVIVIGGILCGVFTATEGSAVAVVYATVLSLIYGSIKIKDIPRIVLESAKITGTITFMIGLSSIMSWAMAFTGIPDMVAAAVLGITSNKIIIFLLINIILLFVGTFMDPTPAILIFTPIFLPICTSLGMNAVQFGIVLCYNLSVGTITPPVGTILFTGCKVGGVTIESVISHLLPYFVMIIIGLLLVTYVPVLSLGLPSLLGLL